MNILEALRVTTNSIKTWAENKFLNKNSVDASLSDTSTNPVQNKIINAELTIIKGLIEDVDVSAQISQAISQIDYPVDSVNGKTGAVKLTAADVGALPSDTDIPDALSDLVDDSTHRTVTDAEKAVWNAKSDFSGSYNDLTNLPTIPSIDGLATEAYVNEAITAMVDSAPETLNTLNELAAALGDDPNFATTIATEIGQLEAKVGTTAVSEQISNAIDGVTADDLGIYVQASEPVEAVAGDIWIDTMNDPSYIPPALPEITAADNGKVLMVVNGKLQLVNLNLSIDANGVASI